jgi:beta-ribofuranosylaminobenzene 5'-phosphate synthase
MIRIVAPSRLHFGLFHVPAGGEHFTGERAFGGVGLMIDTPAVVVTAQPAATWRFEGMLASRAQTFAMRFVQSLAEDLRRPFQVLVEQCPAEHTGLGVGTQLGLSVAKALSVAAGQGDVPSVELARRVGRGERSAIGVHGFDRGGLVIEGGKRREEAVAPMVQHVVLPNEWRVVLLTPDKANPWHGPREREAFASASAGDSEGLRRLAATSILHAAEAGDLNSFGAAIHEFNRRAGEPFVAAQGGVYSSPSIAEVIAEVKTLGIPGVGQSSWGPTVFAIVSDSDAALSLVSGFKSRMPVAVSRVSEGHRVQTDE